MFLFHSPWTNRRAQLLRLFSKIEKDFLARAIRISILFKKKLPDQRWKKICSSQCYHIDLWAVFSRYLIKDYAWEKFWKSDLLLQINIVSIFSFKVENVLSGQFTIFFSAWKSQWASKGSPDTMVTTWFWSSLWCLGYRLRNLKTLPKKICISDTAAMFELDVQRIRFRWASTES